MNLNAREEIDQENLIQTTNYGHLSMDATEIKNVLWVNKSPTSDVNKT